MEIRKSHEYQLDEDSSIFYNSKENQYVYISKAPPVINLVISGGGAKGVILQGAIAAMEEFEVNENTRETFRDQLQNIAGSSVGALTAALIATGMQSNEIIWKMSQMDFEKLLGEGMGPLYKTGMPIVEFMKSNIKSAIASQLMEKFKVESLNEISIDAVNAALGSKTDDQLCLKIMEAIAELEKTDTQNIAITFSMLNALHELDAKRFKTLTVTGTNRESGQTYYFNSENTPNLDITIACRASASLPLILEPVYIEEQYLYPGYSSDANSRAMKSFVDGGYLDNIPVSVFNNGNLPQEIQGHLGQNLQTLALIFDESDPALQQSPFLDVRTKDHALYKPSKSDKFSRDFLASSTAGINIPANKPKNTQTKEEGLETIREQYTQRNIPLRIDIKSTDFGKAKEKEKEYIQAGKEQTRHYLSIHHNEAIYRSANTLDELFEIIPGHDEKMLEAAKTYFDDVTISNFHDLQNKDGDSPVQTLTAHITKYIERFITLDSLRNPNDRWNRRFTEILTQDLADNMNNQLSHDEKIKNIFAILARTYYEIRQCQGLTSSSLGNGLESLLNVQFKNDLQFLNIRISHRPDDFERIINMDKINTAKFGDIKNEILGTVRKIISQENGNKSSDMKKMEDILSKMNKGLKNETQAYAEIVRIAEIHLKKHSNTNTFFSANHEYQHSVEAKVCKAVVDRDLTSLVQISQSSRLDQPDKPGTSI